MITILGSCRQDSLYKKYNVSNIKEYISYPHYTKEILQVINYCLYNNIKKEDTYIFRTPILNRQLLEYNLNLKNIMTDSNKFFIEIASRKYYLLNDKYVHHILYDSPEYNQNTKGLIKVGDLTNEEIKQDILEIINKLKKDKIIIVTHIVTSKKGSRYELSEFLEQICKELGLKCINPVKEFLKRGWDIYELIRFDEKIIAHYTEKGHNKILEVYSEYIK